MKYFNYAIGYYWDKTKDDHIGCYYLFGEVHFGTQKDADLMLEYAKLNSQTKGCDWKIFVLSELDGQ